MGSLTGKKILMILAGKDFQDEEFFQARVILQGSGAAVLTTALGVDEATGIKKGKAKIDLDLLKVNPEEFDAFILIGGLGMEKLANNKKLHHLILQADKQQKLIGAISQGGQALVNLNLSHKKNLILIKNSKDAEKFGEKIKSFLNN